MESYRGKIEGELLDLALGGCDAAFAELVSRERLCALWMTRRITNNEDDARDALQDAMISAFLKLRSFNRQSTFRTWFTSIAMNSARMILRKRRASTTLDEWDEAAESFREARGTSDKLSPLDIVSRRQQWDILNGAIERLPKGLKETLIKHHATGGSVQQVAIGLGLSEAAVKSRLVRAKSLLKLKVGRRARTLQQ